MSRPLLRPEKVANALSLNGTTHSSPTNINMISAVGYTLTWTNGASSTFTVEVSNDYVPSPPGVNPVVPASGTWVAIPLSTAVTSSGTAGSAYIDVVGISAAWIRLTATNSASSGGTWTATVAAKVQ
jgi:hypothetical protein